MKKIRNLSFVFVGIIGLGWGMEDDQPPLTPEMTKLGLAPFASRRATIERIYLVDDEQWGKNLEKARDLFAEIEQIKRLNGEMKELIPLYWNLSQQYDYGPANKTLRFSFTAGDFGLEENIDWGLFFGSKPQSEDNMLFKRRAYLSYGDSLFDNASDDDNDAEHHEKSSHSSSTEGTLPNGSFASRGSTPPKVGEAAESVPLLYGLSSSVNPPKADGLRRRNVGIKK
jgi:hypothetical protein